MASNGLFVILPVPRKLHHLAVILPESSNRHFLHEMVLVFHLAASPHFDERTFPTLRARCLLHKSSRLPILHRDKSRWADHVREAQLILCFLGIAVSETEIGPVEFKLFRPFGPEMADLESIFDLGNYKRGKNRVDNQVGI